MLLVYTHKITPRIRYVFEHFFKNVLGIPVDFTSKPEIFIAQNGPKMSYTNTSLGDEFFVSSNSILFEQGIQHIEIKVSKWEELPAFFECSKSSTIPFDVFSSSFFLLSRYEEYLPHIKDEYGRYKSSQSIAVSHNFLENPLIDLWAVKVYGLLLQKFPKLKRNSSKSNLFIPLIKVVSPYQYIHKSFFRNMIQTLINLSQLKFWNILEQYMVLLGLWKDPWNNFNQILSILEKTNCKPRFFFLFSKVTYYNQGISIFNKTYHSLIKKVADYHKTSLLASTNARDNSNDFKKECIDFESMIHRNTEFFSFNLGITNVSKTYRNTLSLEKAKDFSLGYHDKFGYRASTAVPFCFYDLINETQTNLLLFPVIATEEVMRSTKVGIAFEKLNALRKQIPTETGVHVFSVTNTIFSSHYKNKTWIEAYNSYILNHG